MKLRAAAAVVALVVLSACGHPYHDNVLSTGTLSTDGTTVQLTIGNCHGHSRLRVATSTATEISLVAQGNSSSSDKCGATGIVCLKQPLGDRRLVDAPTDQAIALRVDPTLKRGATGCTVTL